MTKNTFFLALVSEILGRSVATGSIKEQTVDAYYQAVDSGDQHRVRSLLSANFQARLPVSQEPLLTEAFLGFVEQMRLAFPDMRHDVRTATDRQNTLTIEGQFTGTNDGPFNGMPPTHRRVSLPFTSVFEFNTGGMIARLAVTFDPVEMQRQLQ